MGGADVEEICDDVMIDTLVLVTETGDVIPRVEEMTVGEVPEVRTAVQY